MGKWLSVAAVLPFTVATAVNAQMKSLAPADVASVARSRTLDLRMPEQQGIARTPMLVSGMLIQRDVAPNASVGLGLADMYGRKKGSNFRIGDQPTRSKKPAVSFNFRF